MPGADAERRRVRVAQKRLARIECEQRNLAHDYAGAKTDWQRVAILADAVRSAAAAPGIPPGAEPDYSHAIAALRELIKDLHKVRRAAAKKVLKEDGKRQKKRREVAS